jgi:hypothetical protein
MLVAIVVRNFLAQDEQFVYLIQHNTGIKVVVRQAHSFRLY